MSDNSDLTRRQLAGQAVETKMREYLLNFAPAHDLKVGDVLYIARLAGTISFDAFEPSDAP